MAKKGPYTDDKYQFNFNFINQIPPGVILVSKNVFTGEVKTVEQKSGDHPFKAIAINWFPWIKTKYVSSLSQTIDYKEFGYLTKDRVGVMVDIALEVKIVDPAKYEFVSSSVSNQLKVIIDDAVRKIFNNTDVETILSHRFDLYTLIKPVLDSFKIQYGVEISKVSLQNIKLPEGVRKSYEQRLTTQADVERIEAIGRANANAKKVEGKVAVDLDKKMKENAAKVEIGQLKDLVNTIKELTPKQLSMLSSLAPALFADGGKHLFVNNVGPSEVSTQENNPSKTK